MTTPLPQIRRAHLIFSGRCNMPCQFCYVQFLGHKANLDRCRTLVERCRDLGAEILTVNGGDPYMFPGTDDLIRFANVDCGLKVHVDTNGIKLKPENYDVLEQHVYLLGTSLDGVGEVNDNMRGFPGHFQIVRRHLEGLRNRDIDIKVNTCVTRENWQHVGAIGDFLDQHRLNRWSLYQFWPLEAGNENADRFTLTNEQFQFAVAAAQANSHSFTVEPSPVSERVGTYFLFNDLGDLLVRTHDDPNHYQTVGSILDDDVVRRWSDLEGETVRARAKSRYTE